MQLECFKKKGKTWVRAVGTDKILFNHCAENQNEVTMSKYIKTVRPLLLFMHRVGCIELKPLNDRS